MLLNPLGFVFIDHLASSFLEYREELVFFGLYRVFFLFFCFLFIWIVFSFIFETNYGLIHANDTSSKRVNSLIDQIQR